MNKEREEALNILPIGSVVVLKNGIWINIVGVDLNDSENNIYDYAGYIYPYGCINNTEIFLFNTEKIDKVIFKGYSDEKLLNYYEDIIWNRNNKGDKNGK